MPVLIFRVPSWPTITAPDINVGPETPKHQLTLTQKHTTKTGQLSKMLYHIPIAFVRVCMSVEAGCTSIGEKIRDDKDNRSNDKRLINLHFAVSLAAEEKQ